MHFCMSSLLLALIVLSIFSSGTNLKIAIVGGGIGGASSAYFLRTLTSSEANIEIHLFNKGNIGGRLTTVQIPYNGKMRMFEAGGSVIHTANLYFKNWMEEFRLHKTKFHESGVTGIWNGEELVFLSSSWYLITFYRLLKRYGIDQIKSCFAIKNLVSDFENIYALLNQGKSFDTLDAMIIAMSRHLGKLVNMTMKEYLAESGYHEPFIMEFANAALNCNYGQSVKEVSAFLGFVGLAGSGSSSSLYSVNGSNKLIVEKLLDYSKVKLVNSEVTTISKRDDHFMLYGSDGQELGANYNYVIVAVPLHQNQQIEIKGKWSFVVCVVADEMLEANKEVLQGSLRVKHWSLSENDGLTAVITCNNSLSYNAIGIQEFCYLEQITPVDYQERESLPGSSKIWKIFSSRNLNDLELSLYFNEIKNVKRFSFLAYPEYRGYPADRPKFRLAKNICFVNAVEWLASAAEISAIGGRNCVNMLLGDLGVLKDNKITETEL